MNEDSELLRSYVHDGSQPAFTELVRLHFDLVYSAALRQLGADEHRARDVAQIVFSDLARKAASLQSHPALSGWLYTATHFASRKLARAEYRRSRRELAAHTMETSSPPTESGFDWERLRPHLDAAMQDLGTRDREAVLLRFFEQRPFAEIAARLGVSENAAAMSVGRALEKLRRALARRGISSASSALALALADHAVAAAPAGLGAAVAGTAIAEAGAFVSAGASALGILQLMATTKLALGLTGLCGVLALGTGIYFAVGIGFEEAADGTSADAALRARLLDDRRQLVTEMKKAAELRSALGSMKTPKPATAASATEGQSKVTGDFLGEEIAENPQLRHVLAQSYRAQFKIWYGPLFHELGLKPEEIDRFGNLQLKMFSDIYDLQQAARLQNPGAAPDDPALASMEDKIASQRDSLLRDLLGESGFQEYTQYEATLPAQPLVNSLAANLYYSPTPLSAQEADQLTRIIAAQIPPSPRDSFGLPKVDAATLNWDNILSQAQGALLPGQVAALQSLRARAELDQLEQQGAKDTIVKASAP
jgi:RNA polymerase sigma factor (sigma-70 family)